MNLHVTYGAGFAPKRTGGFLVDSPSGIVFNVPDKSPVAIRRQISGLKKLIRTLDGNHVIPAEHSLIDGVYTRSIFIPKGTVLVGKIHRKECINIIAKGDISVLTESGAGRFQAGHIAVSGAGTQKVGYAHEDTIFVNVFRTDEKCIEKIEAEIATEDESCLLPL